MKGLLLDWYTYINDNINNIAFDKIVRMNNNSSIIYNDKSYYTRIFCICKVDERMHALNFQCLDSKKDTLKISGYIDYFSKVVI